MRLPRTARPLGLVLVALALGACALGPDFERPAAPAADRVVAAGTDTGLYEADGHAQRLGPDHVLPSRWWERFGSPELDRLVATALDANRQLRAARATLHQSEETLAAGYGVFYPQVGAGLSATRERSAVDLGHGLAGIGPYNVGTASASVSYVPDLFGMQRRTVEALGASVDFERDNLHAAQLSLVANLVNAALARAAYADQRDASAGIVDLIDQELLLTQAQVDAGVAPYAALLALRTQRAAAAAARAALAQRVEQSEHLLAQLSGSAVDSFVAPAATLDAFTLPQDLPDALPAEITRQRPDILAAEALLHGASAQIGVATANLFPSLTLGGTLGASNSAIAQVLHAGTHIWSLQANLAGSVFSGGSQWHARKAAIAAYDAALAQYEQSVLAGLAQVADCLRALDHDAEALRAQAAALEAARDGRALAATSLAAGTAGDLDLLIAESQVLNARLAYLGAVAQRLQDTVALYAAIGGGALEAGGAAPR